MTMTTDKATIKAIYKDGREIIQTREVEHRFYGLHMQNVRATEKKIKQLEQDLRKFNKDLLRLEIIEIR